MKIRNILIIVIAVLIGISSGCKKEELEQLRNKNQELSEKIEEKDSTIKELTKLYDQVERKIQLIAQKKKGVSLNFDDVTYDKARKNLENLRDAMETNKEKIKSLNKNLKGARYQAHQYKKQVNTLEARLKRHEDSLQAVNKNLEEKKERIDKMIRELKKKDSIISDLNKQNRIFTDSLKKQNKIINTAYIAVKPEDKLEKQGIIMKKGGFLGFLGRTHVVDPGFDKSDFNTFNIADNTTIPIDAKEDQIEMVTAHPDDSYALIQGDKGKTVLKITKPDKFWKAGNFLVAMY
jgi:predicted  nucleic acid-binding Zn-ribbon protein